MNLKDNGETLHMKNAEEYIFIVQNIGVETDAFHLYYFF